MTARAAYPLWVIERAAEYVPGWIARLLLDGPGVVVAPEGDAPPTTEFEYWLLGRWLRDIRSEAFRGSVQGQQLIAEWERGR